MSELKPSQLVSSSDMDDAYDNLYAKLSHAKARLEEAENLLTSIKHDLNCNRTRFNIRVWRDHIADFLDNQDKE